ncbi:MAG: hypothetical protein H6R18_1935 [Proteobacteria bacterium]|nr:hypothetical protein [Pseudomonadota bacterium]
MNLSKGIKVTVVEAAATAATSELVSDVLDMSGYEGVLFLALTGDVTASSVLTLTVKANSANSVSSPTPVTQKATAAFTAGASDADSKLLMVDVYKPTLRYVFASLTRADQNAVIGGVIAIQYGASNKPTTQDASVIASAFGLGVAS